MVKEANGAVVMYSFCSSILMLYIRKHAIGISGNEVYKYKSSVLERNVVS